MTDRRRDLERIGAALVVASEALEGFLPGAVASSHKSNLDPVTEADLVLDRLLREILVEEGEGWLSEETADDSHRLSRDRVWVVDPLDGTKEFVAGIPEWCVSIGLVEDGEAVAGGVLNPAAGFLALGADTLGCTLNGEIAQVRPHTSPNGSLKGATVLASRSEVERGEWKRWERAPFLVCPMGSVAYKLARVACGLADATWTLVPKHEWDVAAGTALVTSAGGRVTLLNGESVPFNRPSPSLSGLVALRPGLVLGSDVLG